MKTATVVGAGLVGSLWAVYLAKAGYKVQVFERRPDIRNAEITAGKSINLALSDRGWKALKNVGIDEDIRKHAIPMNGRTMHNENGELTYQPYGQEGQAIWSVSRGGLNATMMTLAEELGDTRITYDERCENVDLENGIVYLENTQTGKKSEFQADVVFGTDGAFSAVRYSAMQIQDRFEYSQRYIEDGYRELLLPANEDGSYKLEKHSLHIWPRGRFMLIALPNEDGSFTCTLFMPFSGHQSSFDKLKTSQQVEKFFQTTFPDFYEMMPNVSEVWKDYPLASLAIIRCYPWAYGKTVLMGDAAHATVPFYGQGMNCGFEDCTVMWELMQKHNEDWELVFAEYQELRKPSGDAVQDLSLHNYHVMRDFVADPQFLLQKRLERKIQEMYPDKYAPLYSMVTFSHIPYQEAIKKGEEQDKRMKALLKENDIEALFEKGGIEDFIHEHIKSGAKV